jgi:chaperonin GroEL
MSHTKLLFHSAVREKLPSGTQALADAVRVRLRPRPKSVVIRKAFGPPIVCDEGVTIAREIKHEDPAEDVGAQLLKKASERTGEAVGDGTSTATVRAAALFAEGSRDVAAGASAVEPGRGLESGLAAAVGATRAPVRAQRPAGETRQVDTISARGDEGIGWLVAETPSARLDQPAILVHENRPSGLRRVVPLPEAVMQGGRPLLVAAEDLDDAALATPLVNTPGGTRQVVAVEAPGFGGRCRAMLDDIGVPTGCRVVAPDLGADIETLSLGDPGRAASLRVDRDNTTIVGGGGAPDAIAARRAQLRREIEETTGDYAREKLQERPARLLGGVAVIRAGTATEAEPKGRKEAFDDAPHATRAAVEEGIVPGAGPALVRATDAVEAAAAALAGDRRTGALCLAHALAAPARQIAGTSGTDGGVAAAEMRKGTGGGGVDAAAERCTNLAAAGIPDPTRVLRVAPKNAVPLAGIPPLTEATMVAVTPDEEARGRRMEKAF